MALASIEFRLTNQFLAFVGVVGAGHRTFPISADLRLTELFVHFGKDSADKWIYG